MSDPSGVMRMLGLSEADPATDAATPAPAAEATPSVDPEVVDLSLDEALAEARGTQEAPQEAAPATDAEAPPEAPSLQLTPEQIAAILAENERFKAAEALAAAEAEEEDFAAVWDEQRNAGAAYFAQKRAEIIRQGQREGKSEAEIKADIYDQVVLRNDRDQGWEAWRDEHDAARRAAEAKFLRERGSPSAVEQVAQQYQLDPEDRAALAQFANYPKDHLDAMARMLASKNARLATTQTAAVQQAADNVVAKFARLPGPGTPAKAPPVQRYQYRGTPDVAADEARLMLHRLGVIR